RPGAHLEVPEPDTERAQQGQHQHLHDGHAAARELRHGQRTVHTLSASERSPGLVCAGPGKTGPWTALPTGARYRAPAPPARRARAARPGTTRGVATAVYSAAAPRASSRPGRERPMPSPSARPITVLRIRASAA